MADTVVMQSDGGSSHYGVPSQLTNGQSGNIKEAGPEQQEEVPMIDINIVNVVCSFNTKCHLNLKKIATEGSNVEYHRQHGMLNMRIRHPFTTASIWSSGKVTCTGSISEEYARIAARKVARKIQKLGYSKIRFCNFRVVNVLGTCAVPFAINMNTFARERKEASYEPELHPGATYRIKEPKATLKIFSTGSITVTAPRVANVQSAIEYIYPIISNYNAGPRPVSAKTLQQNAIIARNKKRNMEIDPLAPVMYADDDYDSELDGSSLGDSDDDFDSEASQD